MAIPICTCHIYQSGPSYLAIWSNHKCKCILLLLKFRRCISQITSFQIIKFNIKKLNFVTQFDNKSGFKRSMTKVTNFSKWISPEFLDLHYLLILWKASIYFLVVSVHFQNYVFLVCLIEHYASLTLHFVIFLRYFAICMSNKKSCSIMRTGKCRLHWKC